MINISFLEKIATVVIQDYATKLDEIVIVLPNKRAKVFLIEALQKQIANTIICPEIISIEDFVQDVASIRSLDSIELLFEFYEVYLSITEKQNQQSFELFANWAKTLLQDFNEIDRYLLDPSHVLSYLKDIEDIKKWGIEVEDKTKLLENYIDFWKLLPIYYEALYLHLLNKGLGYQGLIYREAVNNLNHFSNSTSNQTYIFAGFNALNAAEERIVQHLLALEQAKIYWDVDSTFLNDPYHDAGLFVRRFKESWKHYKSHTFDWIVDDFSQSKNIQVIGTPKTIGQAKLTGSIIEKIIEENPSTSLDKVAIVLGEENLLMPVLYALPSSLGALNITMGYSSKNNPSQILIAKLFKMHTNAISRKGDHYVFYYKDVLDVLTHPLIEPYAHATHLVKIIKENNYTFITHKKILELNASASDLFLLLFQKWENGALAVLDNIAALLLLVKENFNNDNEEEKIAKTFVFAVFKVINKLINYYSQHQHIDNIDTLYAIYKQIIEVAEVSFEGEPLRGLQIMGVLESRVLDFDTVIVTSMNEGKFPAGKSQNSFIPYDVKKELGLPTFKEKDAIYTYHFYHLLQRAKNIYLIYNTENDGLDAGERSRFITQLEVEKQSKHQLTFDIYNPVLPTTAYQPMVIPKSEAVMERLKEIATTGFSPSALTSYIRNPIDFYFQKILRIREVEEVEENIALNTLGTIIHETLKALYDPFVGRFISETDISNCFKLLDDEVLKQFKLVYKEGEIKKGRNLLAFEVAKRNVLNFLKLELEAIKSGDAIKIIALEKTFERELIHQSLPFPVLIKGNVDRIELRNGKIRIIDYKTGKVERANVVLKSWNGLTKDLKNDKIIQVLAYAFMFENEMKDIPMEAGIISFKNLKSGFLPFGFKEEKELHITVTKEILANYVEEIVVLLNEIFDRTISFEENI
ncbi:PD-(D/E)XK nuclease family protein [Flavobacterium sp. Fl-77]|uniref:PD-(D/E)XK nuclease family protein n=1 Tax=Flavobacterium flavipigmentatum TaxID=2893884 RepID=A0AAJ2S684_9FLAO|nr:MULTISPECIES: PD-(D/E)XK nuclease family protein [unclassified Flavobacterium]MDX6180707.1 PD-(D/E)XK nuclease family protein [Flavobacterium sp. Fl-33]MDX6184307.1 PD-(D/E)XK nuclease family protein [Flavobacterium sp. Fl-77]UFH39417.1 PD-(D/E)XK nuclease family protein [Flavobacterium sp. F-70]